MNVHFSSLTDDWKTPKSIYDALDKEFHFDFDPCPINGAMFEGNQDGLTVEWGKSNFVNPPYSMLKYWIKKAYNEHRKGKTVVMLIPSRTDTAAWHDYVMKASEIRFIRGRLKFEGAKWNAPFPSAVVIFRADDEGMTETDKKDWICENYNGSWELWIDPASLYDALHMKEREII